MAQDITQEQIAQIQAVIDASRNSAVEEAARVCEKNLAATNKSGGNVWCFGALEAFNERMQAIEAAQGYLDSFKNDERLYAVNVALPGAPEEDALVSAGKNLTTAQKQRLWDAYVEREAARRHALSDMQEQRLMLLELMNTPAPEGAKAEEDAESAPEQDAGAVDMMAGILNLVTGIPLHREHIAALKRLNRYFGVQQ